MRTATNVYPGRAAGSIGHLTRGAVHGYQQRRRAGYSTAAASSGASPPSSPTPTASFLPGLPDLRRTLRAFLSSCLEPRHLCLRFVCGLCTPVRNKELDAAAQIPYAERWGFDGVLLSLRPSVRISRGRWLAAGSTGVPFSESVAPLCLRRRLSGALCRAWRRWPSCICFPSP